MYTLERLRKGKWHQLGNTETPPVEKLDRVLKPLGWGVTDLRTGRRWECRCDWQGLIPVSGISESDSASTKEA